LMFLIYIRKIGENKFTYPPLGMLFDSRGMCVAGKIK